MNKKYKKIYEQEMDELNKVTVEFNKLSNAFGAYREAMYCRIQSAEKNGELVKNHSASTTNSHQREIDRLREASLVFAEKIGGRGFRKALDIFHKMHDEIFEALEMESGTIL